MSAELLHPELFDKTPVFGGRVRSEIARHATEITPSADRPKLSVVIRTRNEREQLEALLDDLDQQEGINDTQVIIVDTESTDGTRQLAEARADEVIRLTQAEFTYPKASNLGVEAADNPVAYVTVGHALMATTKTLIAATNHFTDPNVAGVFANVFPGPNASVTERIATMNTSLVLREPHAVEGVEPGLLGATSTAISKEIWSELGKFDPRYEAGGEDTELGRKMLEHGYDVVFDPLLNVHHSHGIGPINAIKQVIAWNKMLKGPQQFDAGGLRQRRPDLYQKDGTN
jgi:glycosyltransferase involved in cell wall biosynthesis